ncbi:hypothetical protein HN385_01665 [archaeon]|jgi:hypothetical protein|nr:hypothetical protein [archaeon]MBT3451538.1 hypothetical protein [archaeon]MBT6869397.1 hypothetical protein [archaeon]MBT7192560.1 hypothetical protein [archaeon]MBT7380636.1 hypothetical protein [archaeon]
MKSKISNKNHVKVSNQVNHKSVKSNQKFVFASVFIAVVVIALGLFYVLSIEKCDTGNSLQGMAIAKSTLDQNPTGYSTNELEKIEDRDIWSEGELFNLFDRNKDGYLSYSEFEMAIGTIVEE